MVALHAGDGAALIVGIYAQLSERGMGGIAEALLELVTGLGSFSAGDESYVLIASRESAAWLQRHLGPNQRIAVAPYRLSHHGPRWEARAGAAMRQRLSGLLPSARWAWRRAILPLRTALTKPVPPHSDGFIESLGVDLVHFPYQEYVRTSVPTIFEPWDLQHRHLPQFFTPVERRTRDGVYSTACRDATAIVVGSDWVRADLMKQYAVPESKVFVVRRGPPPAGCVPTEADQERVRVRYRLPESFVFYPAHTWPHKNHLRVIEALALLRKRDGVRIHFVCSGKLMDNFKLLQERVHYHGLQDQVSFLGYVPPEDLAALFLKARAVVVPSLFEGYGFPVLEAFRAGTPVACSNVTSLPEMVGDAAVTFDPHSTEATAEALRRVWSDSALRESLVRRSTARLAEFDSRSAALTFRALYRKLAGRPLDCQDRELLEATRLGASRASTANSAITAT